VAKSIKKTFSPRSFLNWRLFDPVDPSPWISELYLYSDAHFIADAEKIGPYAFLNTIAHGGIGSENLLKPSIALRFRHCIENSHPNMTSSNFGHYHGGTEFDEIAAIVSLELGCRIQAGPVVREFAPDSDPLGRPMQLHLHKVPTLPRLSTRPLIPRLSGQRDLRDLYVIKRLFELSDEESVAFIKAARLYQQAVWVADTNPELSWILLVSAIEAVMQLGQVAPIGNVAELRKSYAKATAQISDEQLSPLADALAGLFGSTRKFVAFLVEFFPPPPPDRPSFSQFVFSKPSIRQAATKIYKYRSMALHGGVAFPGPMCTAPMNLDKGIEEIPSGLAAYSKGATWMKSDLPCHLHIFEHLVRGSLLNWINSRIATAAETQN
jgi:hypothetical protein